MLPVYALAFLLSGPVDPAPPAAVEDDSLRQLLHLRRVYVDRFGGGETAAQMRDMIITALENTKLFVITENQDKADAVLRGSAEDLVYNDVHTSSDGINVHSSLGTTTSEGESALHGGTRTDSRTSRSMGLGVGDNESSHSVERRHEANAAVRLVNKDGDVIWSTTQESLGGKFRGSSADVADKVMRKLLADYDRARKLKP
jgi:hypothetical protein